MLRLIELVVKAWGITETWPGCGDRGLTEDPGFSVHAKAAALSFCASKAWWRQIALECRVYNSDVSYQI